MNKQEWKMAGVHMGRALFGWMLIVAMLAGLALVMGGCGPVGDTRPLPGQARAIEMIWVQSFGQMKMPPEVYWRRDACNESNGIYGTLPWCTFMIDGAKMAGLETTTDQWVEVGAPSDGFAISDTALAHELLHAVIGDDEHKSPAWNSIGPLNKALKLEGL